MKRSHALIAGIIALLLLISVGCADQYCSRPKGEPPPDGWDYYGSDEHMDYYVREVLLYAPSAGAFTPPIPPQKTERRTESNCGQDGNEYKYNPDNPYSTPDDVTDTDIDFATDTDAGLNVEPEDLPTKETPVDSNDSTGQDSGGCGYD